MMRVVCTASVDDEKQRDTLVECLKVFGVDVAMNKKTICIEYGGDPTVGSALVEVFEDYKNHGICILE